MYVWHTYCMCNVFEDQSKPVLVPLGRPEEVGLVELVLLTVMILEVGEMVVKVVVVSFGNSIWTLHRSSVQQQKKTPRASLTGWRMHVFVPQSWWSLKQDRRPGLNDPSPTLV